jgi:preprotein translocase SecE subunit
MRHLTYVILTFVLSAILTVAATSAALSSAFQRFGYEDWRFLGLVNVTSMVALVAGGVTFFALFRSQRAVKFTDEVLHELFRVTWPTREETVRASVTVVVVTAFTASMLALYDFIWKNLADIFLFNPTGI